MGADTTNKTNTKMVLAGTLAGVLLCFTVFSGFAATGFAVGIGTQTISFNQLITEDTLITLSVPENLTSFSITGRYQGSGDVNVRLVGPNRSWHLASYDAPQVQLNSTYVLERGGTVVQLAEGEGISYTHVFEEVCGEACDQVRGPFYLQVRLTGGEFLLTSASYTTPQIISRPQTPEEDEEVFVDDPTPEVPERENPPLECTTECAQNMVCNQGYCISATGHLNITDSSGRLVALFDKHGRVLLAGDVIEHANQTAPANAFRIQNRWGDVAWVTDQGDLYLTGRLIEGADEVPLSGEENFIIRNPDEIVLAVQGASGDLFTKSTLVTNILP